VRKSSLSLKTWEGGIGLPAIFGHGKGRPAGHTQSHQHTDGSLFPTSIMPVYTGRIFLPGGVYSQRTPSALDVIVFVCSVQYAQDSIAHVSRRICVGEEVSSQRRGKRW
jgi:hypothetical protein